MRKQPVEQQRRGAITPLAAILMTFLLGMVAFAVDMGWICLSESELQNAADAAALAGAGQLMSGYVQYNLPGQTSAQQTSVLGTAQTNAKTYAKNFAGYNAAGGVSSLTLKDADIEFGFIDSNNNYTALPTYTGYPNTIKVTMRRDSTANGSLSLFFANVLGVKNTNLKATASATIYAGIVDSFSAPPLTGMIPMTYDVNNWKNFLATGQDPDGNTTYDANGNPEIQIYPSVKAPGNFGQLSLNDSHAGESTESGWVDNGMSASDLAALVSNNLIPLSAHNSANWDWVGDTGMKSSLISTINSHAGQTYFLPLFNPFSPAPSYSAGTGNGSHYYYQIVQIVPVTIMSSASGGVIVQPAAVVEPNAVFAATPVPAGSSGYQSGTTFTTPKLSN